MMDSTEIKYMVNEIRSAQGTQEWKDAHFRAKYPEFVDKLPKLYMAALNSSFPLQYLDLMLEQYEKLRQQRTTVKDADEKVYGELRSNFVDPLVTKLKEQGDAEPVMQVVNEDGTRTAIPQHPI